MDLRELVGWLQEFDLMLDSDPKFPNLRAMLAGAPPREMYRMAMELRDHPDVLTIKLVSGKITFIHRPLWIAVYAVGTAREPWQTRGLSKDAAKLLRQAGKENCLLSSGDAVRELETRLLVHARSVHTERGFHQKQVQTWKAWADSVQFDRVALTPAEGKAQLEAVVARLNARFGARGTLPWPG
jgi:hypothetical protein